MKDYYKLTFLITSGARKTMQKLLLIGAIAFDIGNFFVLIDCIFGSWYYLFLFFGLIVVSTAMRIASIFCNYSYLYLFNGGEFIIYKAYSLKTSSIIKLKTQEEFQLSLLVNCDKTGLILCNSSCEYDRYLLTTAGKNYVLALDPYMLALIKNRLGKECDYDIS